MICSNPELRTRFRSGTSPFVSLSFVRTPAGFYVWFGYLSSGTCAFSTPPLRAVKLSARYYIKSLITNPLIVSLSFCHVLNFPVEPGLIKIEPHQGGADEPAQVECGPMLVTIWEWLTVFLQPCIIHIHRQNTEDGRLWIETLSTTITFGSGCPEIFRPSDHRWLDSAVVL